MRSDRQRAGLGLASLGAVALLLSLWQPWFRFQIPAELLQRVNAASAQFGVLGGYIRQGAAAVQAHGAYHFSGWFVFHGFDVVLCVLAIAGLALGVQALAANGRVLLLPEGPAFAGLGLVAAVLVGYHMLHSLPLPHQVISLDRGAWIALAGAAAMLAGGLVASAPERETTAAPVDLRWDTEPPPAETGPAATWSTSSSVAPPGV